MELKEVLTSEDKPFRLSQRDADYIITGDKDLLELKRFKGIKIVNVGDFAV